MTRFIALFVVLIGVFVLAFVFVQPFQDLLSPYVGWLFGDQRVTSQGGPSASLASVSHASDEQGGGSPSESEYDISMFRHLLAGVPLPDVEYANRRLSPFTHEKVLEPHETVGEPEVAVDEKYTSVRVVAIVHNKTNPDKSRAILELPGSTRLFTLGVGDSAGGYELLEIASEFVLMRYELVQDSFEVMVK